MNAPDLLVFLPWPDPAYDPFEQPPAGAFSRRAWLPTLGPTSWVLWGLLADQLAMVHQVGWQQDDLAIALGLGPKQARLSSTLKRLCKFRILSRDDSVFGVRMTAAPLTTNGLARLPADVTQLQSGIFGLNYVGPDRRS